MQSTKENIPESVIVDIKQNKVPSKAELEADLKEYLLKKTLEKGKNIKNLPRAKNNEKNKQKVNSRKYFNPTKPFIEFPMIITPLEEAFVNIAHRYTINHIDDLSYFNQYTHLELLGLSRLILRHKNPHAGTFGYVSTEDYDESQEAKLNKCKKDKLNIIDRIDIDSYKVQRNHWINTTNWEPKHHGLTPQDNGRMNFVETIEYLNHIFAIELQQSQNNTAVDVFIEMIYSFVRIEGRKARLASWIDYLSKEGLVAWLACIYDQHLYSGKTLEVVFKWTRYRFYPNEEYDTAEEYTKVLKSNNMGEFLELAKRSKKLRAYLRETKLRSYIVNGLCRKFKIYTKHEQAKFVNRTALIYTWKSFIMHNISIVDNAISTSGCPNCENPFCKGCTGEIPSAPTNPDFLKELFAKITQPFKDAVASGKCKVSYAADKIEEAFNGMKEMFTSWTTLGDTLKSMSTKLIEAFGPISQKFSEFNMWLSQVDKAFILELVCAYLLWQILTHPIARAAIAFFIMHKLGITEVIMESISEYFAPENTSGEEDTDKTVWEGFIEQVLEASPSTIGVVASVFVTLILGKAIGSKDRFDMTTKAIEVFKNMHFIGAGLFGCERLIKYIGVTYKIAIDYLKMYYRNEKLTEEQQKAEEKKTAIKEAMEWLLTIETYRTEEGLRMIRTSKEHFNKAIDAYNEGFKFTVRVANGEYPRDLCIAINERMKEARKIFNLAMRTKRFGKSRNTPFHIQLYGEAGHGKSSLIHSIVEWLRQTYYPNHPPESLTYTRSDTAHWDEYNEQKIVVKDEAYPAKIPEKLIEDLFIVSSNPALTPQASEYKKGTVFLQNDFYITCSNIRNPKCNDVYCMRAIWRRRHLLVKCECDPRVFNSTTHKFDHVLFNKYYPNQPSSSFPHMKFAILNPTSEVEEDAEAVYMTDEGLPGHLKGFKTPLSNITFKELLSIINNGYNAMRKEENALFNAGGRGDLLSLNAMEINQAIEHFIDKGKTISDLPAIFATNYLNDIDVEQAQFSDRVPKLTPEELDEIYAKLHKDKGRPFEILIENPVREGFPNLGNNHLGKDFEPGTVVPCIEALYDKYYVGANRTFNWELIADKELDKKDKEGILFLMEESVLNDTELKIVTGLVAGIARPPRSELVVDAVSTSDEQPMPSTSREEDENVRRLMEENRRRIEILKKKKKQLDGKHLDEQGRIIDMQEPTTAPEFGSIVLNYEDKEYFEIQENMSTTVKVDIMKWKHCFSREQVEIMASVGTFPTLYPIDFKNRGVCIYIPKSQREKMVWQRCDILDTNGYIPIHTQFLTYITKIQGKWYIDPSLNKFVETLSEAYKDIPNFKEGGRLKINKAQIKRYFILNIPHFAHSMSNFMDRLNEDQRNELYYNYANQHNMHLITRQFRSRMSDIKETFCTDLIDKLIGGTRYVWEKIKKHMGKFLAVAGAALVIFGARKLLSLFQPVSTSKTFFKGKGKTVQLKSIFTNGIDHPLDTMDSFLQRNLVSLNLENWSLNTFSSFNGVRSGKYLYTVAHPFARYMSNKEDYPALYLTINADDNEYKESIKISLNYEDVRMVGDADVAVIYCRHLPPVKNIDSLLFSEDHIRKYGITERGCVAFKKDKLTCVGEGHVKRYEMMEMCASEMRSVGPYVKIDWEAPKTSSGAPFILPYNGKNSSRIIGFQSCIKPGCSYIAIASKDQILQAQEELGGIKHLGPLVVEVGVTPTSSMYVTSNVETLGSVPRDKILGNVGKTSFIHTPIADHFESPNIPAILTPHDKRIPHGIHPLQDSVNKTGKDEVMPLRPDILKYAIESMSEYYSFAFNIQTLDVLSLPDNIRGVLDNVEPVNIKTSPGIPYIWDKYVGKEPGKKAYIRYDEEGNISHLDSKLRLDLNHLDASLRSGVIPPNQMYEFPKDELRPREKALGNPELGTLPKTRSISVFPMTMNLLYRKYFMALDSLVRGRAGQGFPICVGISPESMAWTNIYYQLASVSSQGMDLDVSKWDGHWSADLAYGYLEVVNKLYTKAHKIRCKFCTRDDECPEIIGDNLARTSIFEFNLFGCFQFDDGVYRKQRGMSSGFAGTSDCNSGTHLLLTYVSYLTSVFGNPELYPFQVFLNKVGLLIYSDDIVMAINEEMLPYFSYKDHINFMTAHGWPITAGNKTGKIEPVSLDELTFLKRKFVADPLLGKAVIYGALSKTTIEDMFFWMRKHPNQLQQFHDNVRNAFEYAFAWGPEYYNDIRERVANALREERINFYILSYSEQRMIMLDRIIK